MRTSPLRAAARGARRRGLPFLTLVPAALALTAGPALGATADTSRFDFVTPGCGGVGGVAANEFTVPAGVTSMDVVIRGEQGGTFGGMGAELDGTITVTPGETLYACVAEGGGAGGQGLGLDGQRGGGYALLGRYADLDDSFGIAGGGGGYGGGPGGNGGDASMIWETRAPMGLSQGSAGAGLGADGNGGGTGGMNADDENADGGDGTIRRGGAGGAGVNGGGGGGGGVFGGGGGAASYESGNGAGGGGGTSYCDIPDCSSHLSAEGGIVSLTWAVPPTVTTTRAAISTPRPNVGSSITYTATVSPARSGGTVEFRVGDDVIWGCDSQPVDSTTGVATCAVSAPYQPGAASLTTKFSGAEGFAKSDDTLPFTVYSGAVTIDPSPTAAFGDVALGGSTTKQFTVTNSGDGTLTIDELHGIYLSEYMPRDMPDRSNDFSAVADLCSGRTLVPSASCSVTVKFAPTALGERRGELIVLSDAYDGADPVDLTGVGVESAPETREPETRQPETQQPQIRQPETQQPQPQTQQPAPPAAPAPTPTMPAETARTPAAPKPVGASSTLSAKTPAQVTQQGGVRLPLVCAPGQACQVAGTLTLAITGGQARAAASTKTRVLVRFSGVKIAAGATKTLSLKLPAAFVKAQQAKGVRKLRTTLTVRTTLGNGQRITRRQAVTLLIPRASVAQRATPRQAERPSFTG